jgi:outer membrane protein assembly factor BamB
MQVSERRWRVVLGIGMLTGCLVAESVAAADWPYFRGPNHDGISTESAWRKNWDVAPPRQLWQSSVGVGFSGISVAGERVITLGHVGGEDVVVCLEAKSGRKLWEHRHESDLGAKFYIGGPGSTPTIDVESGRVFLVGKWGKVFALGLEDGREHWSRDLTSDYDLAIPDWGFDGSALLLGDRLILNLGQGGIALAADSGKTRWASDPSEAGYSTPVPFSGGVIVSSGESYSAVKVDSGEVVWTIPWFTRYGVNAADPIVWKDRVFVSSGYQKGCGMFALGTGELEVIWKERRFRTQQNAALRLGDFIYGMDGDSSSRATLKCLSWSTGEVMWEDQTFGYGAVSAADGYLIVLASDGRLGIAKASGDGFEPIVTRSYLESDCWTVPVLANGQLYCRNSKGTLICLDVSLKP